MLDNLFIPSKVECRQRAIPFFEREIETLYGARVRSPVSDHGHCLLNCQTHCVEGGRSIRILIVWKLINFFTENRVCRKMDDLDTIFFSDYYCDLFIEKINFFIFHNFQ